MDLNVSESQAMLRRTAREVLATEYPAEVARKTESSDKGYSPQLWSRMAELGWLGISVPPEYGGGEAGIIDQLILAEELGRSLVLSPFITSDALCGQIILNVSPQLERTRLLAGLCNGTQIFALALAEENTGPYIDYLTSTVTLGPNGYRLTGVKSVVPYAVSANKFIVCARNQHSDGKLVLVLVNSANPSVSLTPLKSIANQSRAKVMFDDVPVSDEDLWIGEYKNPIKNSLESALQYSTVIQCGEMLGRAERILELVIHYCTQRVQFGRPIGSFQALQHQCADLKVSIEIARLLTYRAACAILEGSPSAENVAMAKVALNETSRMATTVGHGIFAGVSYTIEHDMQLFSARNKLAEANMGNTIFHCDQIAKLMEL